MGGACGILAPPPIEFDEPFLEKLLEFPARSERLSQDSTLEGLLPPSPSSPREGGDTSLA